MTEGRYFEDRKIGAFLVDMLERATLNHANRIISVVGPPSNISSPSSASAAPSGYSIIPQAFFTNLLCPD